MINKEFGKKVHFYRKRAGLTQGQLGERLGVSQVTIAHYESGRRFPKGRPLRDLALVLSVSVDTLLGVEGDSRKPGGEFLLEEFLDILLYDTQERGWQYLREGKADSGWTSEDVFLNVFIPLLEVVGDRWAQKEIIISQEHQVSERIRTLVDLMTAEELEKNRIVPDISQRWLGLCAPSEQHDLVLYMSAQLMRLRGWDVRFLGKGVPLKDLREMLDLYKPHMLVFSITLRENRNGLDAYLEDLAGRKRMPDIVVGGRGWESAPGGEWEDKVRFIDSLKGYIRYVDEGRTENESMQA